MRVLHLQIFITLFCSIFLLESGKIAYAQNIPGPADVGRIHALPETQRTPKPTKGVILPQQTLQRPATPAGAEDTFFTLKNVTVHNATVFKSSDIAYIYGDSLNTDIPLSKLWDFANALTDLYQSNGYFLSRAYVPAQEIDDGNIRIEVIEGYIGAVEMDPPDFNNHIVRALSDKLIGQSPLNAKKLESTLLRMNDLPGMSFEAILDKLDSEDENAVKLILVHQNDIAMRRSITADNHGSRFIGPERASLALVKSFKPLHNTNFSVTANLPSGSELWSAGLSHSVTLSPELSAMISLEYVNSHPGFTLEVNDLDSQSISMDTSIKWQAIRQRHENLSFQLGLSASNVYTDILGTPLTRDRIRTLHADVNYDFVGLWDGYTSLTASITQGLDYFGATKSGAQNLSRSDAEPDFTKFSATLSRQDLLTDTLLMNSLVTGQRASKPLYSSEEFGFGGSSLGRAYDSSELTGDHGLAGSVELHWLGITPKHDFTITPYAFYDIGKVWNEDSGQEDGVSAAAMGLGLNVSHPDGLRANTTLAQPLTKEVDTPHPGQNSSNPRLYFQVQYGF